MPFAVKDVAAPLFRPADFRREPDCGDMTAIFLVMCLFWAIRYNGVMGFAKHVFGVKMQVNKWVYPLIALLFLFIGLMEVVFRFSGVARPVALAMAALTEMFSPAKTCWTWDRIFKTGSGVTWPSRSWFIFTETVRLRCAGVRVWVASVVAFVGTMLLAIRKNRVIEKFLICSRVEI